MKETFLQLINLLGFAFWAEIRTTIPRCTYYFGPFLSKAEAEEAKEGYLEDLFGENAQGIHVNIKRFKPKDLTIFDESNENLLFKNMIFSRS